MMHDHPGGAAMLPARPRPLFVVIGHDVTRSIQSAAAPPSCHGRGVAVGAFRASASRSVGRPVAFAQRVSRTHDLPTGPTPPSGDDQRLREQEVVRSVAGSHRDGGSAFDHVGKPHYPLISLLGAHGSADDEFEAPNAEVFAKQPFQRRHVVADTNARKLRHRD
jgi:hypothetical protein